MRFSTPFILLFSIALAFIKIDAGNNLLKKATTPFQQEKVFNKSNHPPQAEAYNVSSELSLSLFLSLSNFGGEALSIMPMIATAWQITVTRIDPSPQPSGTQMLFRIQLQCSAVDESISNNAELRFPAQSPSYFTMPVTHPAVESFSFDSGSDEWVVDLQDVIFAGTSIEFDILARSPNHITPDGTVVEIDATISSDNSLPASDSDSGAWSATANLGVEKYLQFGPDTDALLDIPVRYYIYPCDPSYSPNATGHLYLSNWTLVDTLPAGVVYNNSSGTYDAGSNTVTWSDTDYIVNEDCDFEGESDYWIEVTFPSTTFGEDAIPPIIETENTVHFEGYPYGAAVIPANQMEDTDVLLHGFGLPNPIGDHTKTAYTKYYALQTITYADDQAQFVVTIRTNSASTTPYYFKIIDPLPCLDNTTSGGTQYISPSTIDPACANPAYQPTDNIQLKLNPDYLTITDEEAFVANNPTIPLQYEDTNGNLDTLHVAYSETDFWYIIYQIDWADVQSQLGAGVGISKLIWDSEDFDVQMGLNSVSLRAAAQMILNGTVAENNPPTYPMLNQYRVRNYAYFYIEAGGQEDSLGYIQDDVTIFDEAPALLPQKSISASLGLVTLTADSEGAPFADNDTLIMTDLLPFGYTFKNESQQYISLGGSGSWSWSSSNGDTNGTPYSELDNISVRNYIDVEVIDDYNGTGRQLVRVFFLPPPTANIWEDLGQFRFSYYVNEAPMAYSAVNQMEVFPSSAVSSANLQCQTGLSHYPSAAASNDPNDLDGDGVTTGDAYCLDTQNITPSSTTVEVKSYKAVRGDAVSGADFEGFPAIGDITTIGGTADFQINLQNIGGIGLDNLVIYDVLPHTGDTGLSETQIGNPRGSDFDAVFAGIDNSTLPTGTVVEYSTSVNACRNELTTGATPFPTGCVNDWTTTPPSPLSSVKSLRFSFPSGDIQEFLPGEQISIEYAVTYPSGVQPGEVAWNNFAYAANRIDDGTSILPTEPPKVGIAIPQVDLSVTKSASPTPLPVGEPAEYTLQIQHDGEVTSGGVYTLPFSKATNVTLTDNFLSLGLTIVPGSVVVANDETGSDDGINFDTSTGNITIPEIEPGASYTITYQAYSNTEQSTNNTLEVRTIGNADDSDSTPGNGILSEDDMDDAGVSWVQPAISIRKLVEDAPASGNYIEADASDGLMGSYVVGQPINYRFIVKNTGSTYLSSVQMTDDLTGFLCDQSIGYLAAGDSTIIDCNWSFGFTDSINPYVNTATATGTYNYNNTSMQVTDSDSASVMVYPECFPSDISAFAIQASCTNGNPNNDAYLQISAVTDGNRFHYSLGSTFDDDGGSKTYDNASVIGALPDTTSHVLPNPLSSQNYTIRIYNGASHCFIDVVVTLEQQDCTVGCDCTENIYLNETTPGAAKIHKFGITPFGGSLVPTEIGNPWFDNNAVGETFTAPHGLGTDLNGKLYIAESDAGDIRQFDCDGNVTPAGTYEIATDGVWNIGSIGNTLYANARWHDGKPDGIYAFDLCTGNILGYFCLNNLVGNTDTNFGYEHHYKDWGMYLESDGTMYVTDSYFDTAEQNDLWVFNVNDETLNDPATLSPVCIDPLISSNGSFTDPAVDEQRLPDNDIWGVTSDTDGNIYIIENIPWTQARILKYSSTGAFIKASVYDNIEGSTYPGTNPDTGSAYTSNDRGWFNAIGIVYSETSDRLYISTTSPTDDCVALFNTELEYLGAAVPFTNSTSEAKGISKLKECCPTNNNITIDTTLCAASINDQIFLQELINCEGTICEGIWQADGGNTGIDYNSCDQTITVTALDGCGTFTLESDGLGNNPQCGAFVITVNVEVEEIATNTISGNQTVCSRTIPSALTSNATSSTGTLLYQWQSSTTSCDSGFTDIAGANSDTYTPDVITEITYFRLVTSIDGTCASGTCSETSNCVMIDLDTCCPPMKCGRVNVTRN